MKIIGNMGGTHKNVKFRKMKFSKIFENALGKIRINKSSEYETPGAPIVVPQDKVK